MVSKKDRKDMEEVNEIQENMRANSEDSFDRDLEFSKNPIYSSEDIPTDIYRYKRMRLVPNSEAEFQGLVDKDVVLANIKDKKPDPDYLRFVAETIVALDVFSKEAVVIKYDDNGRPIMVRNDEGLLVIAKETVLVPDPDFDIIRSFLRASFKSDLTLSRAMGKDREAVLDRTQGFTKELKRPDKGNKYGG